MQTPVKRPTAKELQEIVHRLSISFVLEQANMLSCRTNMYPQQCPDSYTIHEERNRRNIEQPESVKSDLNEKFIQLIIHPTEYVISELNSTSLYLALESEHDKKEKIAANTTFKLNQDGPEYEFMFLSADEETTIHLYNYVQLVITIASQCIKELEEMEIIVPKADEQKNRKSNALEKWRTLDTLLGIEKKRLLDKIDAFLAKKYHTISGVYWKPKEIKFVDLDACEMFEF